MLIAGIVLVHSGDEWKASVESNGNKMASIAMA